MSEGISEVKEIKVGEGMECALFYYYRRGMVDHSEVKSLLWSQTKQIILYFKETTDNKRVEFP